MKVGKNSWLLSALGQKQTFAPQKAMSALPPKAECAVQLGMSALCQKQTHAVQQFSPLLGQLVGGQLHFFETVSPSRSPPVVGAMLRVSLVMGPPRISLVIGQCMSLVVGTRIWLVVGPRI